MKSNILLVFLMSLLLISCHKRDNNLDNYYKSFEPQILSLQEVEKIITGDDINNFILIDIRDPHKFAMGHLQGAVNIPAKSWYRDKYKDLLKNDKNKLIYGENSTQARLIASYANFVGIKNVKAILGGYEFLYKYFYKQDTTNVSLYDDERPQFSYKEKFESISKAGITPIVQKKKQININIPIKKKQLGGGCD